MPATPTPTTPRKIFEAIARYTRKAIRFVFKTIAAVALAAILLAILLPPVAFAIRSTQPMNDPLFNGLSFYQVTRLRYEQYQNFVTHYNTTHPADAVVKPGMCFWTEVANSLTNALLAEVCTLAKCSGLTVVPTGPGTYPEAIWTNFEKVLVDQFNRAPHQPVGACRLPPSFPPPENPSTSQ
jgi:hypothetical protein